MGRLVEKFSRDLKAAQSKNADILVQEDAGEDVLGRYKESLESGSSFTALFSVASKEGDLILVDENAVRVVLKVDEIVKEIPSYTKRLSGPYLSRELEVRATEVDEDSNTVYVSLLKGSKIANNEMNLKRGIIKELRTELENGNHPTVYGSIASVNSRRACINILNKDILGLCYVKDWKKTYTRNLVEECSVNEIHEFQVTDILPKRHQGEIGFVLSRKELTEDPWEKLPKELMEKGAQLTVRCLEVPKTKTFWWGTTPVLPGIELMGDFNQTISIKEGLHYKCKVKDVDMENHSFKIIPYALASGEVENKMVHFVMKK